MEQIAERRNRPRLKIIEEVFSKNGESLGYTADLNAYGMMLIGHDPFPIGKEIIVCLDIPNGKNKKIRATFTAECRWSEPQSGTAFYNNGFRFVYKSQYEFEFIETLFFGLTENKS